MGVLMPVRAFIVLDNVKTVPTRDISFVLMPVRAFIVLDGFGFVVLLVLIVLS